MSITGQVRRCGVPAPRPHQGSPHGLAPRRRRCGLRARARPARAHVGAGFTRSFGVRFDSPLIRSLLVGASPGHRSAGSAR